MFTFGGGGRFAFGIAAAAALDVELDDVEPTFGGDATCVELDAALFFGGGGGLFFIPTPVPYETTLQVLT